jgi:hypothetical protein
MYDVLVIRYLWITYVYIHCCTGDIDKLWLQNIPMGGRHGRTKIQAVNVRSEYIVHASVFSSVNDADAMMMTMMMIVWVSFNLSSLVYQWRIKSLTKYFCYW